MLRDITLGQYFPGNSVIHRLDPRVKIVLTLAIIVALFLAKSVYAYLLTALLIFGTVLLSRVPASFIFKGLKPLLFIVIFTAIFNVFFTEGTPIFQFGFFRATYEGLWIAVFMVVRLLFLVTVTTVLTLTTSPILLTDGLESLLAPLTVIKVPAHELAMMMTIALRFIPTLLEETDKIMKAQSARGADFESGNLLQRAKAMIPILVPLFISAFRRADELAVAMECRCYHGGENRTRMRQLKTTKLDYIAMLAVAFLIAGVVFLNRI